MVNLDCLHEFAVHYIHKKVKQLISASYFAEADYDDLLQDFALNLLERQGQYDPERGSYESFIAILCDLYAAKLAKRQKVAKARRQEANGQPRRYFPRSEQEGFELSEDVASVIKQLPEELQEICRLLMRGETKRSIAQKLGVSRPALLTRLRKIRQRLQQGDLQEYLS